MNALLNAAGRIGIPILGAICIILACGGCATFKCPSKAEVCDASAPSDVQLRPGDVVRIKFAYWPELDEQQAVRPDGKIALQLVGEVQAEGFTPLALQEQLVALYATKLNGPVISVILENASSHRAYIGGEVYNPGLIVLEGRRTLLSGIMQAGGPIKESARLKDVIVVRQQNGKQLAMRVDLRKALNKPESDPFYLEPQDVVYVPRTAIDRVDQWVDQYINKIIPNNVHWTISTDTDSTDVETQSTTLQFELPGL